MMQGAVLACFTLCSCGRSDARSFSSSAPEPLPQARVLWSITSQNSPYAVAASNGRFAVAGGYYHHRDFEFDSAGVSRIRAQPNTPRTAVSLGVFDGNGLPLWLVDGGARHRDHANDVAFDGFDNVVTVGREGILDKNGNGMKVFVAKYDREGNMLFDRSWDVPLGTDSPTRLAVNRAGAAAVLHGRAKGVVAVARLTPNGESGLAHLFPTPTAPTMVALGDDDTVYVASSGTLCAIAHDGHVLFNDKVDGELRIVGLRLAPDGRAVVAAYCRGSVGFAGRTADIAGWQICLAAVERSGGAAFLRSYGSGPGQAIASLLAIGKSGEMAVAGVAKGVVDFLPSSTYVGQPFVLFLDARGTPRWSKRLDIGRAMGRDRELSAIAIDERGNVIVAGAPMDRFALALASP